MSEEVRKPGRPRKNPLPSEGIVRPLVKDARSPHVFERLEANKDLPELTSIGFAKVGETNKFVSYVIKSQGNKVLSIDVSDPDIRGIIEETSKIDFVTNFIDQESDTLSDSEVVVVRWNT